jgi:putative FmdB family regulatory protein
MPLYEYECLKCGTRFEQIQKFSDAPVKTHEGCGGKVRKLLSAPAIQFKGTGWYVTDYGRGGNSDLDRKGEKKQSKEAKAESTTESKTSGETKSAAAESTKAATTESSKK